MPSPRLQKGPRDVRPSQLRPGSSRSRPGERAPPWGTDGPGGSLSPSAGGAAGPVGRAGSCPLSSNCGFVNEGLVCGVFCRKAEEYLRLSQVKCTGLMAQMTATSSAVMCLDLAAGFMKQPVDKVRCSV